MCGHVRLLPDKAITKIVKYSFTLPSYRRSSLAMGSKIDKKTDKKASVKPSKVDKKVDKKAAKAAPAKAVSAKEIIAKASVSTSMLPVHENTAILSLFHRRPKPRRLL